MAPKIKICLNVIPTYSNKMAPGIMRINIVIYVTLGIKLFLCMYIIIPSLYLFSLDSEILPENELLTAPGTYHERKAIVSEPSIRKVISPKDGSGGSIHVVTKDCMTLIMKERAINLKPSCINPAITPSVRG